MKKIIIVMLLALIILVPCFAEGQKESPAASAASYPDASKSIRIIICRGAGSSVDTAGRIFAPFLAKELGVSVYCENVDGGRGKIGLTQAYRSAGDGYTLVIGNFPSYCLMQVAEEVDDFDMTKFVPIYNFSGLETACIGCATGEFKSVQEIIEHCKANPGRVILSTTSGITNSALGLAMFFAATGVDVKILPYDSGKDAVGAAVGKHSDFFLANTANAASYVKNGTAEVLCTFAAKEDLTYPEAPLFKDLYGETYSFYSQIGILAPPGTPDNVAKALESAAAKAVASPEFIKASTGVFQVQAMNAADLGSSIRSSVQIAKDNLDILLKLVK